MHYFGGKSRCGKRIAEFINQFLTNEKDYIEPFIGGAWVTQYIWNGCKSKTAYDINPYLIECYKSLLEGKLFPRTLSKEEYLTIKQNKEFDPALTGFVGFGCSFAGKWFGGFASSGSRNYCLNAYNSIMKKKSKLNRVLFLCDDYLNLTPVDSVIYCDPPYANTTKYDYCPNFNSVKFWETMRIWSKNNILIISEYNSPEDFKCVAEFKTKTDIRNSNNSKELRIEKLFMIKK
ncbi:MAG: DNA adenine methylase [Patescibacteria group bacterium]